MEVNMERNETASTSYPKNKMKPSPTVSRTFIWFEFSAEHNLTLIKHQLILFLRLLKKAMTHLPLNVSNGKS